MPKGERHSGACRCALAKRATTTADKGRLLKLAEAWLCSCAVAPHLICSLFRQITAAWPAFTKSLLSSRRYCSAIISNRARPSGSTCLLATSLQSVAFRALSVFRRLGTGLKDGFSRVTRYPIPVPLKRASTKSTLLWIVGTFTISTRPTGTPRGARAFFGQRALLFLRPPPRDGACEWYSSTGWASCKWILITIRKGGMSDWLCRSSARVLP